MQREIRVLHICGCASLTHVTLYCNRVLYEMPSAYKSRTFSVLWLASCIGHCVLDGSTVVPA